MNSLVHAATSVPMVSLIDINFILINRIFVLVVTLLFFSVVLLIRRARGLEIYSSITGSIKLSLFGFVLLYAELAMSALPSYQELLQGLQTVIVMILSLIHI